MRKVNPQSLPASAAKVSDADSSNASRVCRDKAGPVQCVSGPASSDNFRVLFLRKLDAADFEVTDDEAEFIETVFVWADLNRPLTRWMEQKADGLEKKYGRQL